jgi:hypothetical protein
VKQSQHFRFTIKTELKKINKMQRSKISRIMDQKIFEGQRFPSLLGYHDYVEFCGNAKQSQPLL